MKFKLLLSALTSFRNLGIFILLMFVSVNLTGRMDYITLGLPILCYLGLSLQSFTSKKFQDNFIHNSKKKLIKNLNETCIKLAADTKRYTNAAYYKKLCSILQDKSEIVQAYHKDEFNYLKERITEQTLNLVITYIKLLRNFCKRSRDLNLKDVNHIMERVNQNTRKLNFITDQNVLEDLKRTIELDEKILARMKEEKQDLERIDTKLDYISSTVNMFKHQIGHSLESEEMLEKIENTLNEAMALETVLDQRQRRKNSAY